MTNKFVNKLTGRTYTVGATFPKSEPRKGRNDIPVMGIRLRKEGKYTIVDAEIGGAWIEVIRELSDAEFCHIVEPEGMYERYYSVGASDAPSR